MRGAGQTCLGRGSAAGIVGCRRAGRWLLAVGGLGAALFFGSFYGGQWGFISALPRLAQEVPAAHGGHYVPFGAISPWLRQAVVAIEDRTFFANWGISVEGIGRALLVDLRAGAYVQGGSTITQELVRTLLRDHAKTFHRKIREALLALAVTARYPKRDILAWYLNDVSYGQGCYGVDQAARHYFGQSPADLSLAQAALLAGLLADPAALNPYRHPAAAKARQQEVLRAMVAVGDISARQAQRAAAQRLRLAVGPACGAGFRA